MSEKERIKMLRVSQKLNQTDFGHRIDLTTGAISDIERGKCAVTDRTRRTICREFGVSEEWLRTGEGEMFAARSREDELSAAVDTLLSAEPPEWRRRLVLALSRFSPSDWDRLERELRFILDGAPSERPAVSAKAERKEVPQERVYRVPQDMTPEELHAELDRQLADEKERGDNSADFGFGSSATAAG